MIKQIRRFNEEQNQIIMNEEFLFAFTMSDGFSFRLLYAEFVIDWEYNYKYQIKARGCIDLARNNPELYFEEGKLIGKALNQFEEFLSSNINTLNRYYPEDWGGTDDVGGQQFLVNLDKLTHHIEIFNYATQADFKSDSEILLFKYNEYLKSEIESRIHLWIEQTNS